MTRIYIVLIVIIASAVASGSLVYSSTRQQIESLKLELADAQSQIPTKTFELLDYSFDNFSFKYPENYFVEIKSDIDTTTAKTFIIRKGMIGRMEIFENTNFENSAPTETLTIGDQQKYNVWLYYPTDDRETKSELHKIFQSLVIN